MTQKEAIQEFKKVVKAGDTVYTKLNHVSRSGMMRHITVMVIKKNEPHYLDHLATKILGWPRVAWDKGEGIKVPGCGMDMGFHLVYSLSSAVWPNGVKCPGRGCHSNDHVNHPLGGYGKSIKHNDGGYALKQKWL